MFLDHPQVGQTDLLLGTKVKGSYYGDKNYNSLMHSFVFTGRLQIASVGCLAETSS
jgi:hypothetical protein